VLLALQQGGFGLGITKLTTRTSSCRYFDRL
jgi:hypothetical protein